MEGYGEVGEWASGMTCSSLCSAVRRSSTHSWRSMRWATMEEKEGRGEPWEVEREVEGMVEEDMGGGGKRREEQDRGRGVGRRETERRRGCRCSHLVTAVALWLDGHRWHCSSEESASNVWVVVYSPSW